MPLWNAIDTTLAKVADLADTARLSSRPLPSAPDGLSDAQAAAAMFNRTDKRSPIADIIDRVRGQVKRGAPIQIDAETASAFADALLNAKTVGLDDRKFMLEYVFTALSRLPPGGKLQQKVQDAAITLLYDDLPHPPSTFAHPASRFREPDGGGNNPMLPDLGRAGTPYARSVASTTPIPPANLPDPALIFESLLKRDTPGGKPHPTGVSSLMFTFAVLIIHSLFRTAPGTDFINDTSSYLDLSPLYGHSLEAQMKVRRNDGTGRMHEDVFAENRLLLMPPAVSALLVLFCRNHNFIATKLLQINEAKTFKDPAELRKAQASVPENAGANNGGAYESSKPSGYVHEKDWTDASMASSSMFSAGASTAVTTPAASAFLNIGQNQKASAQRTPLEEQDHVIFNTARLINCGFFMHIIISDYIGAILGLTREGSSYSLNPLEEIRGKDHVLVGRGEGNACSVEFNLLYRWHATLSAADEKWTEDMMRAKFGGIDPADITLPMFYQKAAEDKLNAQPDVKKWTFHNKEGKPLQRDPVTNRFADGDLAALLHDATENRSSAFAARNTPEVLRIVEILGITQARKWGTCTLNEFRKFIGLKPYESFEEWNPRQEIADAARGLYGHPDNLELYVGMQAEEAKPVIPGAGLCPGYTISRAILADAVALTRGDRFLTVDFTPQNLTVWGYQDCQRDIGNGGFGGVLSKILMRGLPEHYTFNSVYALFPFLVPSQVKIHLTDLGLADQYDFRRPGAGRHLVGVNSYKAVQQVLGDPKTFKVTYLENVAALTNGYGFFLAFDNPDAHKRDLDVMHKALVAQATKHDNPAWYAAKTAELIKEKSFSLSKSNTRTVDIVRDVLNLVPVYWVSQELAGIPLKVKGNEDGLITEQEMYGMMAAIFTFIFLNVEPLNGWQLRDKSTGFAKKLLGIIQGHLEAIAAKGRISIAGIKAFLTEKFYGDDDDAQAFLANLYENRGDLTIEQLSYNILSCMVASAANYSHQAVHVVDFFLDESRAAEKAIICELVQQNTPESERKLAGYVREAMRLKPQAPGIFRDVATDVTIQDGDKALHLTPHNRLFVSLANSNLDPDVFPDPYTVNPDRPAESHNLFGFGMHKCLGAEFTEKTMPAVMKSIFKLKNVRRAPGATGKLQSFTQDLFGTKQTMYLSARGLVTPWPASMSIQYDE